jgi:hypothetical protein
LKFFYPIHVMLYYTTNDRCPGVTAVTFLRGLAGDRSQDLVQMLLVFVGDSKRLMKRIVFRPQPDRPADLISHTRDL